MPIFTLNTNIPKEKIPSDFLKTTTDIVANALGKPASYVLVHINPDQLLSFGGSNDPCGYGSLGSIGKLGKKENKKLSQILYGHLEKTLGIGKDRMYIIYDDLDKEYVGFQGTTFDDLI